MGVGCRPWGDTHAAGRATRLCRPVRRASSGGASDPGGSNMRHRSIPTVLFAVAVMAALCVAAGAAGAAPTGAKNAFTGVADCGDAGQFTFVVNNANGQGQGTENNGNQALFA